MVLRAYRWPVAALIVLVAGALLKSIAVPAGRADVTPEARVGRFAWPWGARAVVTVYFPQEETGYLIPVDRAVEAATPEAALAELAAGPAEGRGLEPAIPPGVKLRGVTVEGERAVVMAEGGPLPEHTLRAIAYSLGVSRVRTGDQEVAVETAGTRLYYVSRGQPFPVVLPDRTLTPRQAIEALLTEPPPEGLPWVPPGVSVDALEVRRGVAYLRLRFTPELQKLVESGVWNFSSYYMGVVYTLTEFEGIEKVRFEFAGLSPLALKQCRTPLAVPLTRPGPEPGRAQGGF